MKPQIIETAIKATCPKCESIATFEDRQPAGVSFGSIVKQKQHDFEGRTYGQVVHILMRCSNCYTGAMAEIHCDDGRVWQGKIGNFYPTALISHTLPKDTPEAIKNEYREAELCFAANAKRGASALVRSTLEKILKLNGYVSGSLQEKIDQAATDGIITESRKKRAHENVRVLGNDVLHDEWREVDDNEVMEALDYSQRIIEDFYDDRPSVEGILIAKNRIVSPLNP